MRRRFRLLLSLPLGAVVVAACETETPSTASGSFPEAGTVSVEGGGSASEGGSLTDTGGEPDADAASDADLPDASDAPDGDPTDASEAGPTCDAGTEKCSGVCVDLTTSSTNCGACDKSCLGAACSSGLCAEEKVSPLACAWSVTVSNGVVAWTEHAGGGCTGAIRKCSTTGCAKLPTAISTPSNYPISLVIPPGTSSIFFTDNQYPGPLRKMDLDGQSLTDFGNGISSNSAGVAANATHVYWGNGLGVHRSSVGTADSIKILSGNMSGAVENGPSSIAIDGTSVYAAPDGHSLVSCPLLGDCSAAGKSVIASEPNTASSTGIVGIATDGTNVFYTAGNHYLFSGSDKVERVVRCPVAGCPSGTPVVLWEAAIPASVGESSHLGIAVDDKNVYWGTMAGTIYFAAKTCIAPCTPTALVTGAKPFGMTTDGPYLYWADKRGGIYRVVRP